jgi:Ca-activated chloride channel family protein
MTWWHAITFQNPQWLWLLPLPLLILLDKRRAVLRWPIIVSQISFRTRLIRILPIFRIVALAALIVALARPQQRLESLPDPRYGIDIALVMDVSESMLTSDLLPNRLEAGKKVAMEFVQQRKNDRFCVTIFAGEALSVCPLTYDHGMIRQILSTIEHGTLQDNSAIGDGLAVALNRLKDNPQRTKVAILLSDGRTNAGYIQPEVAAEIARTMNVRIYTIGIGALQITAEEMDEALLQFVAQHTQGRYFRAKDTKSLQQIYQEIDRLEKTNIPGKTPPRLQDVFLPFVLFAFMVFFLEIVLRFTFLRSYP